MKINNLADYAKSKAFILVREVEGELWFFSAWDDEDRAYAQAEDCGCIVIRNR